VEAEKIFIIIIIIIIILVIVAAVLYLQFVQHVTLFRT